ncbi:S-layer homology domain-containing protein [Veillonella caviae]|uniref:S-layer homology domain-containing protein n=1 Tax=Veillonella caviae TaxID=248316 RepID=UPI0023F8CDBD|nr:S-layer homology domain-containing protein [Veillonella caviae]MCI7694167.1 S-layer homology domain-containing protein [Veillonella caviae]MDD7291311.1 S-layer homology domain-containing protein [Veillonella caviae]MDY5253849.1 S-layer homology domain-containing protein [Veillonella caviae]MDY5787991.1 S-layer homology domain-containing protein [Veillonella caviae]
MKLNKLSLSFAITLALGSTFGLTNYAHAATVNSAQNTSVTTEKVATTQSKAISTQAKTAATQIKTDTKATTLEETIDSKTTNAEKSTVNTDTKVAATKTPIKAVQKEVLPEGIYSDTKDNWARDAIQAMTKAGYVSGYSDNTFRPSQIITREQAAIMYGKVLQYNMDEQELADIVTKETSVTYKDVPSDHWSNSAIKLVSAAGVMNGTTTTTFTPAKTMNREEFVASAANVVKKIKGDAPVKFETVAFQDEANISKTYVDDIKYMAQRGYVASGETTDFNPKQSVTRAQAATILNRILNNASAPAPTKATAAKEEVQKNVPPAKSDKTVETKTEPKPTRVVRPVRRTTTLKALSQKQQESLENNVFTELNKTYKTPEAFQDYGVMYWRDNQLHVALKNSDDLSSVKANLANRGNTTIDNYVVVEPSRYSQSEYDAIEVNFRNYYSKNEKAGNIITVFPDVENNQLYAVVSTASRETQQGMSRAFGSKVKMVVKR